METVFIHYTLISTALKKSVKLQPYKLARCFGTYEWAVPEKNGL